MLLKKFLQIGNQQAASQDAYNIQHNRLYRAFLRREAEIGGQLFGPLPEGGRREFFCLDEYTWIWHEEWLDVKGRRQVRTTRYDVRPGGVVKAQDGQHYQSVSEKEARRLVQAAQAYKRRVIGELYQ
jgi:hypothetical protein